MSEPMASPEPTAPPPASTRTGPGRLLVAIYALFALSASARAGAWPNFVAICTPARAEAERAKSA